MTKPFIDQTNFCMGLACHRGYDPLAEVHAVLPSILTSISCLRTVVSVLLTGGISQLDFPRSNWPGIPILRRWTIAGIVSCMEPIPNFLEVTRRRPSAPLIRHGKEFWQQAVRDQETSGLSLSQFFLERGLAKATFFQWRKAHQYAVQHRNSHQKRMALRFTEGPKDSMWLETTNYVVSLSKQQLY